MSQALQTLHDKVVRYLREMELTVHFRRESYDVRYGRTMLVITPLERSEETTVLRFVFYLLFDVPSAGNDALFRNLNRINDQYSFGRFYWTPADETERTGAVIADANFLGESLDFPVFSAHLHMIGGLADELVPQFQEKYGGLMLDEFLARRDAEAAARAAEEGAEGKA